MGLSGLLLMLACTDGAEVWRAGGSGAGSAGGPHNVLVLIADDLGVEASACYPDAGVSRADQPNIEALCTRGVVFERAWSAPLSSPSRAGMLTGRHPYRTGIGQALNDEEPGLDGAERTLPEALALGAPDYAAASFGKWHLGGVASSPNSHGWPHFSGSLLGELDDYYAFDKVVDGSTQWVEAYATTDVVDDTLAWVGQQDGPWVAWVGFNAPHLPLHLPPQALQDYQGLSGDTDDIDQNPGRYFKAMVQAMDSEIGRLLDGLGDDLSARTTVIYLGDNGTAIFSNQDYVPAGRAKGSLYQAGVHVPLVIAGPTVDRGGRRVAAPVSTVDLFATVIELAGATAAATDDLELDAASLVPQLSSDGAEAPHPWVLTELFGGRIPVDDRGRAVTDGRHKLLRFADRGEELYDLDVDPTEATDLLLGELDPDAVDAYATLGGALDGLPPQPD